MTAAAHRATIYLDPNLHHALRLKAATTRRTISDLVADAVRESLREDEEDLAAAAARTKEPTLTYEALLKKLKADGAL